MGTNYRSSQQTYKVIHIRCPSPIDFFFSLSCVLVHSCALPLSLSVSVPTSSQSCALGIALVEPASTVRPDVSVLSLRFLDPGIQVVRGYVAAMQGKEREKSAMTDLIRSLA